jgi:opacity protein-like surface antigen
MNQIKCVVFTLGVYAITIATNTLAQGLGDGKNTYYVAADLGIFQAQFHSSYMDQTDIIPQNIAESFQQNGYTGGLQIGYSRLITSQYYLGAELAGSYDSHSANFQAGAANTTFSDTVHINNHFDITLVPGVMLNDSTSVYLKVGFTRASVHDSLISPAGFTPTITRYTQNTNANGFVAGLGLEKFLCDKVSIFTEGNYRDYGTINFSNLQNFSAAYTNSSHVYTYDLLLGVAYHFS